MLQVCCSYVHLRVMGQHVAMCPTSFIDYQAGAVRSRAAQRKATSDWMELEKQRGISITSTVLSFEYNGNHINLLDTPGHQVCVSFLASLFSLCVWARSTIPQFGATRGFQGLLSFVLEHHCVPVCFAAPACALLLYYCDRI